jgi:phosphatidylinositol alpha-1,6-mannosyltransferase
MRVLFLTDSLSDLDGVGRYAVRLIAALEALRPGFEVRVLLSRKHRPTSADVPARWDVSVGLPPDYFYYMSPLRFFASTVQGTHNVKRAAAGVDLIHAIKDYPHNMVGLKAARAVGVPCVATGHGTYTVQPLLSERHSARARRTYEGFGGMICVSNYTLQRVEELTETGGGRPPRRIAVPNAVNAAHYVEARDVGQRPWHDAPFMLTIGELKERKGVHVALQAFCGMAERFPDLHYFVVGKGTRDEYHRGLLETAAQAGLGRRVHFLGNVSEDEKVDLLQRAEIFVHAPVTASDGGFEGFGIVYLEASASGTAVVGTTGCGAEDAIVDGETGLLVAPDAGAVQAGLERLMSDDELRRRMGVGGREHARKSSWEDNARRVLALYDEVLGRGPG